MIEQDTERLSQHVFLLCLITRGSIFYDNFRPWPIDLIQPGATDLLGPLFALLFFRSPKIRNLNHMKNMNLNRNTGMNLEAKAYS